MAEQQPLTPERPIPQPDDATQAYWDAARRGVLEMQQCATCGHRRFPPRPMCPRCQSFDNTWQPMSGRGTIYSFVICHPPLLPAFMDRAPLPVILVELEDDAAIRIVGNLLEAAPDEIEIGLAVEVCFEPVTADVVLPQWRRR